MSAHYTLTFVPGCNKNIYYMKVVSEASTKAEIEEKLHEIVGESLEQICDPFCEEECFDNNGSEKCKCFMDKQCFGFDENDQASIHEKIKVSKKFVYHCPCTRDHFRIDEWSSKAEFNKKNFLEELRSKVF